MTREPAISLLAQVSSQDERAQLKTFVERQTYPPQSICEIGEKPLSQLVKEIDSTYLTVWTPAQPAHPHVIEELTALAHMSDAPLLAIATGDAAETDPCYRYATRDYGVVAVRRDVLPAGAEDSDDLYEQVKHMIDSGARMLVARAPQTMTISRQEKRSIVA